MASAALRLGPEDLDALYADAIPKRSEPNGTVVALRGHYEGAQKILPVLQEIAASTPAHPVVAHSNDTVKAAPVARRNDGNTFG